MLGATALEIRNVWVAVKLDDDPQVNRALANADAMLRTRDEIRSLPTIKEES